MYHCHIYNFGDKIFRINAAKILNGLRNVLFSNRKHWRCRVLFAQTSLVYDDVPSMICVMGLVVLGAALIFYTVHNDCV